MMWWLTFSFLLCLLHQTSPTRPPSKESLCGLIVDMECKADCLKCFADAGDLSVNPEQYRACVATQLPPMVAECAVPHPTRRLGRMGIGSPVVHGNHTNANLLPNCMKRKMRQLSRYLKIENRFAKQAGNIVKGVVESKLITSGGDNMLNIWAQRIIICEHSVIRPLVQSNALSCLNRYGFSCGSRRSFEEDNFLESDEDEDDSLESEEDEDEEDEKEFRLFPHEAEEDYEKDLERRSNPRFALEYDGDEVYDEASLRSSSSSKGNGLPYGGTNLIAEELMMGNCIIERLIDAGYCMQLISNLSEDEFYAPIPNNWLPLLFKCYKNLRQSLSEDTG